MESERRKNYGEKSKKTTGRGPGHYRYSKEFLEGMRSLVELELSREEKEKKKRKKEKA